MKHQTVNNFDGGLVTSLDYSRLSPNQYVCMENGCLLQAGNDSQYVIQTKIGNESIMSLTTGYRLIGACQLNNILYIISFNSDSDKVEVGSYPSPKTGGGWEYSYKALQNYNGGSFQVDSDVIGISEGARLSLQAKYSYNETVNIYIGNADFSDKVINTGIKRDGTYTTLNYDDDYLKNPANYISGVNKDVRVVLDSTKPGGKLIGGGYHIYIRFTTKDFINTPFIGYCGPIAVFDGINFSNTKGYYKPGEVVTDEKEYELNKQFINKRIVLSIEDAPQEYAYVELAVVRKFGNMDTGSSEEYMIDKMYPIDGTSIKIEISGKEPIRDISKEEILESMPDFEGAQDSLLFKDRIFHANIKKPVYDKTTLMEFARRIVPVWVGKSIDPVIHGTPLEIDTDKLLSGQDVNNIYSNRHFLRGETYPFAVRFTINGAFKTDAFPICGYDSYDDYLAYQDVVSDIETYLATTGNNKGLYRFPKATSTDDNYHEKQIGIEIRFDLVKPFLTANADRFTDITGIEILIGERIDNFVGQGVVAPIVEQVGSGVIISNLSTTNSYQTYSGSLEKSGNKYGVPLFMQEGVNGIVPDESSASFIPSSLILARSGDDPYAPKALTNLYGLKPIFFDQELTHEITNIASESAGKSMAEILDAIYPLAVFKRPTKYAIFSPDMALDDTDHGSNLYYEFIRKMSFVTKERSYPNYLQNDVYPDNKTYNLHLGKETITTSSAYNGYKNTWCVNKKTFNKYNLIKHTRDWFNEIFGITNNSQFDLNDLDLFSESDVNEDIGENNESLISYSEKIDDTIAMILTKGFNIPSYIAFEETSNFDFSNWKVNVYKENPNDAGYYASIVDEFNVFKKEYKHILTLSFDEINSYALGIGACEIYAGDSYFQDVFMNTLKTHEFGPAVNGTIEALFSITRAFGFGNMIGFLCESKYNHSLRRSTNKETFYPGLLSNGDSLSQFLSTSTDDRFKYESFNIDYGHFDLWPYTKVYGADLTFLDNSLQAKNRIYHTLKNISGAIADNLRVIKPKDFQDYSVESGEIVRIIDFMGTMFSIHRNGVLQLFVDRSQPKMGQDNTTVYGDGQILPAYFRSLSDFGLQFKEALAKGETGLYFIDMIQKAILKITMEVSKEGSQYFTVKNICDSTFNDHWIAKLIDDGGIDIESFFVNNERVFSFTDPGSLTGMITTEVQEKTVIGDVVDVYAPSSKINNTIYNSGNVYAATLKEYKISDVLDDTSYYSFISGTQYQINIDDDNLLVTPQVGDPVYVKVSGVNKYLGTFISDSLVSIIVDCTADPETVIGESFQDAEILFLSRRSGEVESSFIYMLGDNDAQEITATADGTSTVEISVSVGDASNGSIEAGMLVYTNDEASTLLGAVVSLDTSSYKVIIDTAITFSLGDSFVIAGKADDLIVRIIGDVELPAVGENLYVDDSGTPILYGVIESITALGSFKKLVHLSSFDAEGKGYDWYDEKDILISAFDQKEYLRLNPGEINYSLITSFEVGDTITGFGDVVAKTRDDLIEVDMSSYSFNGMNTNALLSTEMDVPADRYIVRMDRLISSHYVIAGNNVFYDALGIGEAVTKDGYYLYFDSSNSNLSGLLSGDELYYFKTVTKVVPNTYDNDYTKLYDSRQSNVFMYSDFYCHCGFDPQNKEVMFTFNLPNKRTTLIYSEKLDMFVGEYTTGPEIYFNLGNKLISQNALKNNSLYEHNKGQLLRWYDEDQVWKFSFVVNGRSEENNLRRIEKEFVSLIIESSPNEFTKIEYETEYQKTNVDFIDKEAFYTKTEYKESRWLHTIRPQQSENKGPMSNEAYESFETGTTMRGLWLKVTLWYDGKSPLYIKEIITNLLLSNY